jgi:CRP-like cAMP-binding protein
VSLFEECSKRDLQIISRHMEVIAVPAGTTLMREGERGDAFYVLLEGSASIQRGGRTTAEVQAGDHVGELALLDPAPRSATIVATTPLTVGVLDARAFAAIVRDVQPLTMKLLRALARRVRTRDNEATAS